MNIFDIYADVDAISMTPSRNTMSYTLRSVPSSPGRSFFLKDGCPYTGYNTGDKNITIAMVIFFSPVNFPMCVTLYFCQVANVVSSELDGAGPAKHVKVSGFVSDSSAASNKISKSDRKPKHLKGTFI